MGHQISKRQGWRWKARNTSRFIGGSTCDLYHKDCWQWQHHTLAWGLDSRPTMTAERILARTNNSLRFKLVVMYTYRVMSGYAIARSRIPRYKVTRAHHLWMQETKCPVPHTSHVLQTMRGHARQKKQFTTIQSLRAADDASSQQGKNEQANKLPRSWTDNTRGKWEEENWKQRHVVKQRNREVRMSDANVTCT